MFKVVLFAVLSLISIKGFSSTVDCSASDASCRLDCEVEVRDTKSVGFSPGKSQLRITKYSQGVDLAHANNKALSGRVVFFEEGSQFVGSISGLKLFMVISDLKTSVMEAREFILDESTLSQDKHFSVELTSQSSHGVRRPNFWLSCKVSGYHD